MFSSSTRLPFGYSFASSDAPRLADTSLEILRSDRNIRRTDIAERNTTSTTLFVASAVRDTGETATSSEIGLARGRVHRRQVPTLFACTRPRKEACLGLAVYVARNP